MNRVLIVDDREESRYLLDILLKSRGYEVENACQGAEALDKARQNPPQLVVSDLLMPVMDGYTLLRQWRADARLQQIPFVVYTATYTDPKDEQLALSLGADAFIFKPAEPEELIARLEQVLATPAVGGAAAVPAPAPVASDRMPPPAPEEEETSYLRRYNEVLVHKLEDKMAQLEKANRELHRDIAERKQAEEEVRRLNLELEQRVQERTAQFAAANAALSEFAYVVSHDLKAPLRAVSRLAQWITEDYASALGEEGKNRLELMRGRIKRMYTLIDGILAYSRIGRTEEQAEPVDLNALLRDVVESLTPPPHIRIAVEAGLPVVTANRTQLEQVFQNLIGNAIQFMDKPEGLVAIRCEDAGDRWRFRVKDNGPGIDPQYHERVFGIFETLAAPGDQHESTGIGLTLVRRIVELRGGKVELASEAGKGCTFSFTLPK